MGNDGTAQSSSHVLTGERRKNRIARSLAPFPAVEGRLFKWVVEALVIMM